MTKANGERSKHPGTQRAIARDRAAREPGDAKLSSAGLIVASADAPTSNPTLDTKPNQMQDSPHGSSGSPIQKTSDAESYESNLIIRASAGTGKTFQLSNRYLQLVLQGNPPERILATTFTRKAAGEILERILYRLARAAQSDERAFELATQLKMSGITCDQCRIVLRKLTSDLHRLRVSTLDSFFLQVAQTMSLELGLPPAWQIVDDSDNHRMQHDALAALLDESEHDAIVSVVHFLAKGEVRRGVYDLLSDAIHTMYDMFLSTPADAWRSLKHLRRLSAEELERCSRRLFDYSSSLGKRLAAGLAISKEHAANTDWAEFLSKGLAKAIVDETGRYGNVVLPDELIELLDPLVEHARAELVNQIASQTEATHRLLSQFHTHYEKQKLDRRALRFSDLTRYLSKAQQSSVWRRLSFRLDATIDSLLLDEFQDTSLSQWEVIRPFARHAAQLMPGRSLLCVGDTKQAIYGWRGGDAELLDALPEDLISPVSHQLLDTSFRSAQPIMDVVNQIHKGLDRHTNLGDAETAVRAWVQEFPEHRTARGDLPGWVSVETTSVTADQGIDAVRADATRRAAERVREIRERAPHLSIAVLVRRNAMVGQVIYELQRLGISASEEGGNPLTDSAAVQLIVSRLILAEHPGDTAARFHLARSPWGTMLGLRHHRDEEGAKRLSFGTMEELARDGFGPAIARWAEELGAFANAREQRRLRQLVELADVYQMTLDQPRTVGHERQIRAPLGTAAFVERICEQRVHDPSDDPVRVMTVHQSKGLQFDVVLLPDLDDRWPGPSPVCVATRNHPMAPVDIVCRFVNKDVRPLFPSIIQKAFEKHLRQEVREDLCVLYVALTRAVHSLQMIISADAGEQVDGAANRTVEQGEPDVSESSTQAGRPSRSDKLKRTTAGLICAALLGDVRLPAATVVFQHGEPDWLDRLAKTVRGGHPVVTHSSDATAKVELRASSDVSRGVSEQRTQLRLDFDDGTDRDASKSDAIQKLANDVRTAPLVDSYDRSKLTEGRVSFRAPRDGAAGRVVTRVRPSSLEGGRESKTRLRDRLPFLQADSLARGDLVHAYLERVGWIEDGLPDETTWLEIARARQANTQLIQLAREFLEKALARPAVRQRLSRDSYLSWVQKWGGELGQKDWQLDVRREQPLLVWQGNGYLSGSMDRLVLLTNSGKPVAAEIVDYKTDFVEGEAAMEVRAKFYRPQMQAYIRGLERMLRISSQRITARIVFLATGEEVSVTDADQ